MSSEWLFKCCAWNFSKYVPNWVLLYPTGAAAASKGNNHPLPSGKGVGPGGGLSREPDHLLLNSCFFFGGGEQCRRTSLQVCMVNHLHLSRLSWDQTTWDVGDLSTYLQLSVKSKRAVWEQLMRLGRRTWNRCARGGVFEPHFPGHIPAPNVLPYS